MMMRDTTQDEWNLLACGICPRCQRDEFQPGPKGGAAQNVECVGCGLRFNITIHERALIFAQVIGERPMPDDWSGYRVINRPQPLFGAGQAEP